MSFPPIFRIGHNRTSHLGDGGTSSLELAVLLPFLFTLALGVFEFGNLIYKYHLITVGVRDGARYLSGMPWDATTELQAKNIAVTGVISGGTKRVSWWSVADVTVSPRDVANTDPSNTVAGYYRGGINNGASIRMVEVSTAVAYQPLGYLGFLGLAPITLSANHEERYIGIR